MNFGRCFFCNKLTPIVFHITEIEKTNIEAVDLCSKCGHEYMKSLTAPKEPSLKPKKPTVNLQHIKTAEDLISFLGSLATPKKTIPPHEPCPNCGMTLEMFDKTGRMGCPKCYDHFQILVERVICPYHNATEHVGKRPKHMIQKRMEDDPVEKMKLLKLRLAKAIELEEYERAAEINEEIKQLAALSSSSSGQ